MLEAGGYMVFIAHIITLVAFYHRAAHSSGEIRVFAKGLIYARPKWVSAKIEHRRKIPWDVAGAYFVCGYRCFAFCKFGVECGSHAYLLREQCSACSIVHSV